MYNGSIGAAPATGGPTGGMLMLDTLKTRFLANMDRHPDVEWAEVEARLERDPSALERLRRMEETGGEPDVIGLADDGERLIFCDCARESPAGRRSLCYDEAALLARKKNPPAGSAERQAKELGVSLLTESLYRRLQTLGEFDLKTSSWIATPDAIRSKGGALFCERRYGEVFVFHNGADSYYSVRGWRGYLCV